ncbi:hypothetical protein ZIOFF_052318 [Zingiber officinale]|uniref:Thioredoxin domain-containing protein n=1 Tax=Zingiber officinale TaxID=94328 RepID=A0A8J5FSE1_ZINOF|nr:hypothetical protein ZIOFF_052318 [Zingiber officinale]
MDKRVGLKSPLMGEEKWRSPPPLPQRCPPPASAGVPPPLASPSFPPSSPCTSHRIFFPQRVAGDSLHYRDAASFQGSCAYPLINPFLSSDLQTKCIAIDNIYFLWLQIGAKKQSFSSFDELLEKSDKPVLVDFYATWCGPCQLMGPILEQVGEKMKDKIQVIKINTEKYTSIANHYQIEALPTFIIFKDGKPLDRFEGALPANQLIQRIEAALKVNQ